MKNVKYLYYNIYPRAKSNGRLRQKKNLMIDGSLRNLIIVFK